MIFHLSFFNDPYFVMKDQTKNFPMEFFMCLAAWVLMSASEGGLCAEPSSQFFLGDAAASKDVVVLEVVSADTLVLKDGETIKLIGLKAAVPDRKKQDVERDQFGFVLEPKADPLIPVEEEALEFAERLLKGKHVRLEFDAQRSNERYQTLAYAFLVDDGVFVNAEILRQGFADLQIRVPNLKYASKLREAYQEARLQQRGLHGR